MIKSFHNYRNNFLNSKMTKKEHFLHNSKLLRRTMLVLAFLIPMAWMTIMRGTTFSQGENSQDGLYHAGMAELGPSVYMSKNFQWTQMSLWHEKFADKELLYHASLDLIFRIERFFGIKVQPPFHFAALIYMALAILAFLFTACRLHIREEWLMASSLLFCLLVPTFTFRFSLLRPHIVSIASLMFAMGLMTLQSFKIRLLSMSIVSFVFAWTYSNPHFIVIIPIVFSLCLFPQRGKKELLIPLVALSCVLLGLLIHPQFPNSFLIWKTQSWDALISPMMKSANLSKPLEMLAPSFGFHKTTAPLYLLFWIIFVFFIRIIEHCGFRHTNPYLYSIAFLTLFFLSGTFVAARAIEYAAPFFVLFMLLILEESDLLKINIPTLFRERKFIFTTCLFMLTILLACYSTRLFRRDCPRVISNDIPQIREFLKENVPAGTAVVNLDWSDFPILFYYDRSHYWQWGMDPVFSFMADPNRTMMLTKTRPGYGGETYPMDIYQAFGCKYAVLLWPRVPHSSYLFESGWKLVKSFTERGKEEGWIYALDERMLHPKPMEAKKKESILQSEEKQNAMKNNPT